MGYFSDLAYDLAHDAEPDGPMHDECAACGGLSEDPATGACDNEACARNATREQADPPVWGPAR